jgi:hypothetical protein
VVHDGGRALGRERDQVVAVRLLEGAARGAHVVEVDVVRQATSCQTSPARPHNTDTATPDRYHTAPV